MDILYDGKDFRGTKVRVTKGMIEHGPRASPLKNISSIMEPSRERADFSGVLVHVGAFVFGLWCLYQFTTGWVVTGCILLIISVFYFKRTFYGYYSVFIVLDEKDLHEIKMSCKSEAITLYRILNLAVVLPSSKDD